MPPPVNSSGIWQNSGTSRIGVVMTPQELTRRAHLKLSERLDLTRSRHVPLSILRQQARRIFEQYLDTEGNITNADDKARLVQDLIAESLGLSPLEEIFREDKWREILILGPSQIIARQSEEWQPMPTRFRDAAQIRRFLGRIVETGEQVSAAAPFAGGFDVRTQIGYRVIGLTPPDTANISPMALFTREEVVPLTTGPTSSVMMSKLASSLPTAAPASVLLSKRVTQLPPAPKTGGSSVALKSTSILRKAPAATDGQSRVEIDPFQRFKQKVSERIISACAKSGVYNLSAISSSDLSAGINGQITELASAEKITIDHDTRSRLIKEIMASMYGS